MKEVVGLMLSIMFFVGLGAAGIKTLKIVEATAKSRIQRGLPQLSPFTRRLTCTEYSDKTGELMEVQTKRCKH